MILNYRRPRLCPACLRELADLVGRLGSRARRRMPDDIAASYSISALPVSGKSPGSVQPCTNAGAVSTFDRSSSEPADPDLLAINAIIYRAAGSTLPETAVSRCR